MAHGMTITKNAGNMFYRHYWRHSEYFSQSRCGALIINFLNINIIVLSSN